MAQWIRQRNHTCEVPGSNPLAAAVVSLAKTLYPHCLVLRRGLKAVGPLVTCLQAICFLSGQVKQIKSNQNLPFYFMTRLFSYLNILIIIGLRVCVMYGSCESASIHFVWKTVHSPKSAT